MLNKRIFAALLASAMMCGAMASCGDESSSSESSSEATTAATEADTTEADTTEADKATDAPTDPPTAAVDDAEIEESIAAESGDAYLAINEEQGWIQYWGDNTNPAQTMLSYNAGVVPITGNGSYTVSVTADTNGFRMDTTGDPTDDSAVPSGLMFSALMIKDGKTLFPDAVLTIDSIVVDGKEIEMTAKNYTSSDNGIELRSNIYNGWVDKLPEDAVSTEGALVVDGQPTDAAAAYSPCIVDTADFATWKTVEVNFTVSGIE
ncbi:MAG: hypothetical protein IJM55_06055 [Ruminococcus sp.]|nr:hypothetical protein [Ruminococcus sp.]